MKNKTKKIMLFTIIISTITIICLIVAMVVEINNMYNEYRQNIGTLQEVRNDEDNNLIENYEEANSEIGKTVEEIKEEQKEENKEEISKDIKKENEEIKEVKKEEPTEKKIINPVFEKPLEGDVIKEYNKENLVYSETLKEWTTHTGIDIKAELATVVKSSEDGTVSAIKNDPRYGITVIISHTSGYETRYSNLLTAEFVTEGEKVKKGQTIGTVGNTASFEVADSPHLHFEILKDNENVDPLQILKY